MLFLVKTIKIALAKYKIDILRIDKEVIKEATMGIEPMMRVLQTPALPLGHVALKIRLITSAISLESGR